MAKKTFPGRFESLQYISDFVAGFARNIGLDDSAIYAVQLAVDEAATNIIEHAYGGEGDQIIECICEHVLEGLQVTLVDHGRSFDPGEVPEPDTDAPLDEVKPRGLGLFFMRRMMDDVKFDFSPGSGNRVIMLKKIKSGGQ
jgi:serine/threonine-protein kinase RsbW